MVLIQASLVKFVQEHEAEVLCKTIFSMAHVHHHLEVHFRAEEDAPKNLFAVTSKLHSLCHCALLAGFISPQLTWCFRGEDYMRCCATLAASCMPGNNVKQHNQILFPLETWSALAMVQSDHITCEESLEEKKQRVSQMLVKFMLQEVFHMCNSLLLFH